MRQRFNNARERIHDLSAGFREVADALEVDTSIEPDEDADPVAGLTEADIEAYAAEAQDDDHVYVRDPDAPATGWLAVSADMAVELCTGDRRTCPVSNCPISAVGGGQR
jgi:hypothetical protein